MLFLTDETVESAEVASLYSSESERLIWWSLWSCSSIVPVRVEMTERLRRLCANLSHTWVQILSSWEFIWLREHLILILCKHSCHVMATAWHAYRVTHHRKDKNLCRIQQCNELVQTNIFHALWSDIFLVCFASFANFVRKINLQHSWNF